VVPGGPGARDPGGLGGRHQEALTLWDYTGHDFIRHGRFGTPHEAGELVRLTLAEQDLPDWAKQIYLKPEMLAAAMAVIMDRHLPPFPEIPPVTRGHLVVEGIARKWLWDASGQHKLSFHGYEDARQRLHESRNLTDFRPSSQDGRHPVVILDGREIPLRQAVAEATAPKAQIAVPELPPKLPLPSKPSTQADRIRAAWTSPILGLSAKPPKKNFLSLPEPPPTELQLAQDRRQQQAEAAAQKRQMEREQAEALKRAWKAPVAPPKPSDDDDDVPDVGTPGSFKPR
jgi:hypothetical protein